MPPLFSHSHSQVYSQLARKRVLFTRSTHANIKLRQTSTKCKMRNSLHKLSQRKTLDNKRRIISSAEHDSCFFLLNKDLISNELDGLQTSDIPLKGVLYVVESLHQLDNDTFGISSSRISTRFYIISMLMSIYR